MKNDFLILAAGKLKFQNLPLGNCDRFLLMFFSDRFFQTNVAILREISKISGLAGVASLALWTIIVESVESNADTGKRGRERYLGPGLP